jgi:hypothetical protein
MGQRPLACVMGLNTAESIDLSIVSVCVCVLSGTSLCDGVITRPEASYRVLCVSNYV